MMEKYGASNTEISARENTIKEILELDSTISRAQLERMDEEKAQRLLATLRSKA